MLCVTMYLAYSSFTMFRFAENRLWSTAFYLRAYVENELNNRPYLLAFYWEQRRDIGSLPNFCTS